MSEEAFHHRTVPHSVTPSPAVPYGITRGGREYQELYSLLLSDDVPGLGSVVPRIIRLFPDAKFCFDLENGIVSFNREGLTYPDLFSSIIVRYLEGRIEEGELSQFSRVGVLDQNPVVDWRGENDDWLMEFNIVPHSLDERLRNTPYHNLYNGLAPGLPTLSDEAKLDLHLRTKERIETSPYIVFDHHISDTITATVSTSVLVADHITMIREHFPEDRAYLHTLSRALYVLDHADADIMQSVFLAKNAENDLLFNDPERLTLIKDAALLNDYIIPRGNQKRRAQCGLFFPILVNLENLVLKGKIPVARALAVIPDALEFALRFGSEFSVKAFWNEINAGGSLHRRLSIKDRRLLRHLRVGGRDYDHDIEVLKNIMHRENTPLFSVTDPIEKIAEAVTPGHAVKIGRVFFVYVPNEVSQRVKNTSVVRYLMEKYHHLLTDVDVIFSTSPSVGRDRHFKFRSIVQPDGSFTNLSDVTSHLRGKPSAIYMEASGRPLSGSFSKSGNAFSNIPQVFLDFATAVEEVHEESLRNSH